MRIPDKSIPAPWRESYGSVPAALDYPEGSIYDAVAAAARREGENTAIIYMNRETSYSRLIEHIDAAARAFLALGVKMGERVLLCLPNLPQTVYCLYALSRLGAVACLIHPLSAEGEIRHALDTVGSRFAVVFDGAHEKFASVFSDTTLEKVVFTTPADELPAPMRLAYALTGGRKNPPPKGEPNVIFWRDFLALGRGTSLPEPLGGAQDEVVVLFSGGTTGVSKGVRISNFSLNAAAFQTEAMCGRPVRGRSMLAAMPMFHGFGLGVCVHTMLAAGGRSLLVPRLVLKEYAEIIRKKRPNYIAGVPTLYEGITRNPYLDGVRLDFLEGVFSGGDTLSPDLKKRFDLYLARHGATVRVREGYGLTECVSASCLTPHDREREGSIGIPFPDTYFAICDPASGEPLGFGETGEICICGPSVMLGYIDRSGDADDALRRHTDGEVWLHTGDLGEMDADGFVYFRQRLKRVIVSSGYNVYPSQVESVIESHPAVRLSCVIGVPDEYRMRRVKAFVVLNDGFAPSEKLRDEILALCRRDIARYALPRELEFRENLPLTGIGKVAYTVLEKEEAKYGKET